MSYIKVYFAGDDTEVSVAPLTINAVKFILRADQNQVGEWVELYAKADAGYLVTTTIVTPIGTSLTKWQLNADDAGAPSGTPEDYGDPLTLGTVDDDPGVSFWIRAKATDDETPVNDIFVTLSIEGIAEAAE